MEKVSTQNYFEHLNELLDLEYQAEKELYFQRLAKMKPAQRRANGYAWFPLEIIKQSYSLGQIPTLKVARTKGRDIPHQFKAGSQVELYQLEEAQGEQLKGMVHWVDKNVMEILFSMDRLPDWVFKKSIGLNSYFDERSYKVMRRAIEIIKGSKNCRTAELRDKLILKSAPQFFKYDQFNYNEHLNESQNKAIQMTLDAQDFMVIHGPPGTGKTTTLVNAIKQIPLNTLPVLVCAPSNAAVDHLVMKLNELGLNVIRIGNLSKMKKKIWDQTLNARIDAHPDTATIKKMKKEASELRRKARKFKRNFGDEERRQRKMLFAEAKDLSSQIKMAEDYLIHKLINQADVIATTLVGVENRYLEKIHFETSTSLRTGMLDSALPVQPGNYGG